jgi:hypothetical protein
VTGSKQARKISKTSTLGWHYESIACSVFTLMKVVELGLFMWYKVSGGM